MLSTLLFIYCLIALAYLFYKMLESVVKNDSQILVGSIPLAAFWIFTLFVFLIKYVTKKNRPPSA